MKRLSLFILLLIATAGTANAQIISQYIETDSGTTPKGIEIVNNTASTLDFTTNNLLVRQGTNGGALTTVVTVNTGELAPNAVMVIGTSDMGTYLTNNDLGSVKYQSFTFTFNGDDALSIVYGGVTTDVFGTVGFDPGTAWSGNGVSTANQNIQLKEGITTGDTDGWSDPSERFETVNSNPSGAGGLEGFGISPIVIEEAELPTVTTGTAGSITPSSATITDSEVTDDGGANITERGVVYSTTSGPTVDDSKVPVSGTTGTFNADLTGLASETQYFLRAFATNSAGTSYGSEIDFTTTAATGLIEASETEFSAFSTTYGSASTSQNVNISGGDLSGDITVSAPTGFEVSLSEGSGYDASVIIEEIGGDVASTTVYVRIAASTTPGTPSGDLIASGGGAEAVTVSIPASTVSAKVLTIADAAVTTKSYDGSALAAITGTLTGIINDDDVSFSGTGTFDTADAGEDKAVTSTSSLTGDDAGNYTLTQPVGLTGTITKADQEITFNAIATQSLSAGSLELSASSNSGLTITYESSNTAVATVSGSTATFVGTGTTTITASQAGDDNYNAAISVERELVINDFVLIAGWDFQTTTNGGTAVAAAPNMPKVIKSNFGDATLHMNGTNGSSDWIAASSGNELTSFAGTATVNTGSGFSTTTTTGALVLLGGTSNSANGKSIVFAIDMANREDLSISYASQRTSAGFTSHTWAYSTDASSWTTMDAITTIASSFATITLPTITALDGVKTAYLRLTVTGATQSTGNNRFDNIQFQAVETKTITLNGSTGYRLLSLPIGGTFNTLLGDLWTQGFTGADASNGTSNVYVQQGGASFTSLTDQGAAYPAGYGVAVGVFEDDDVATPGIQGGFPKVLSMDGVENAAPVAITPSFTSDEGSWEYVLAGNPFWSTIDWDLVEKGADVSETIWVWSPTEGNYISWNGSIGDQKGGYVAAGQGFYTAYDGPLSTITFTNDSKSSGGSFRGKEAEVMAVRLALRDGDRENSTWLQFAEDGTFGRDSKDAVKMAPMSASVFQVYTHERVSEAAMDIHYLPIITETLELPLALKTSASGEFTLVATDIRLPEGWDITIRDENTSTSQIVNLNSEYTFESDATPNGEPRFTLIVEPLNTTEIGDQKSEIGFELAQNYPNPFNPSTVIGFQLSVVGEARLTVYDILGREVAILVEGVMQAGSHSVNFDASNITSGVYVYKLEAGGQVMTKRMTLVK
jgi:hypothetical protein